MKYVFLVCAVVLFAAGLRFDFGSDLSICRMSFGCFVLGDVIRRFTEEGRK